MEQHDTISSRAGSPAGAALVGLAPKEVRQRTLNLADRWRGCVHPSPDTGARKSGNLIIIGLLALVPWLCLLATFL